MIARPARPLWLITLADLSLLLVGFFVFVQATQQQDARTRAALAAGIRDAFGGDGRVQAEKADTPLAANIVDGFAPGSARPGALTALDTWAADATRDPRTALVVTGYADGSAADRLDGSALALAAARATAVAAALEAQAGAGRVRVAAAIAPSSFIGRPAGRRVVVTVGFGR
jgi:flagellar motor protein MotB